MDDIMQDQVAQVGAGMTSTAIVGKIGGAAAIKSAFFTKLVGASTATKFGGAIAAGLLNPVTAPWLIVGGISLIGAATLNKKFKWW